MLLSAAVLAAPPDLAAHLPMDHPADLEDPRQLPAWWPAHRTVSCEGLVQRASAARPRHWVPKLRPTWNRPATLHSVSTGACLGFVLLYQARSPGLPWAPAEEGTARARLRIQVSKAHTLRGRTTYRPTESSHRQDPSRVESGVELSRLESGAGHLHLLWARVRT